MPFESKAQQRFMYSQYPKIAEEFAKKTNFDKLPEKKETQEMMPKLANEWAKKTQDLSPEKRKEYQDSEASSSAAGGALTKEDIPKKVSVPEMQDVFMNVKKDVTPIRGALETSEDDTLMGRLAKRMAARDYIDGLNLGRGTKAQRTGKAALADNSDNFADMDVIADKDIPRKKVLSGTVELKQGEKVEHEHDDTIKKLVSKEVPPSEGPKEIAKDHLEETGPGYYPGLKKLEDGLLKKNVKTNAPETACALGEEEHVIPALTAPEKGLGLHHQTLDSIAFNGNDPISSTQIGVMPGRNMAEQAKLSGNKFIID